MNTLDVAATTRVIHHGMAALLALCVLAGAGSAVHAADDDRPHAGAGPNQRVDAGAKVVMAGNGRVAEGRIVRFVWVQVEGPRVALHNSTRSTASFTAPKVKGITVLKFRLTVTDTRGRKANSVVTVTVVPKTQPTPPAKPST